MSLTCYDILNLVILRTLDNQVFSFSKLMKSFYHDNKMY